MDIPNKRNASEIDKELLDIQSQLDDVTRNLRVNHRLLTDTETLKLTIQRDKLCERVRVLLQEKRLVSQPIKI